MKLNMIISNLSGGQHVINLRRKPVVMGQHDPTARRAERPQSSKNVLNAYHAVHSLPLAPLMAVVPLYERRMLLCHPASVR